MIKNFSSQVRGFAFAALTLFCLTASSFAGSTATQPVKDVDAPARKPFQTALIGIDSPAGLYQFHPLVTVPTNQRLVIQRVSGACIGVTAGYVGLSSNLSGQIKGFELMPSEFLTNQSAATSTNLYANPGEAFGVGINNTGVQDGTCLITVSGYFVDLP